MGGDGRLGRLRSAVLDGVEATLVTVEVHLRGGLPRTVLVGLPGTAVRESLDRIHSACAHSGHPLEPRHTTINLAPASHPKSGAGLDLPIALALLAAEGHIEGPRSGSCVCVGELGLDGAVRPVSGALPVAMAARRGGYRVVLVPRANATEAAAIPGVEAVGVGSLREAVAFLQGEGTPEGAVAREQPEEPAAVDLSDVAGHAGARRALELAAAGGHHLLMAGPPGAGKTLLARALPGLLPPLSFEEALETNAVYSVVGRLAGRGLLRQRPFRAPHHTVTTAGLVGGGVPPRPGEVSLAHHGVLFLDELPEFRRRALESLRQPLEEGEIVIVRRDRSVRFPARFQLVAAMNPCPCGRGPADPGCRCSEAVVEAYWRRVSGPLLDRLDLFVAVGRAPLDELIGGGGSRQSSAEVRGRVVGARQRQARRIGAWAEREGLSVAGLTNAALPPRWLRHLCRLPSSLRRAATETAERLALSARGWHRVLRVARTAADLDGAAEIEEVHLQEAFQYRQPLEARQGPGPG